MNLRTKLICFLLLHVSETSQIEKELEMYSSLILDLQKNLHFGCISIVQPKRDVLNDLRLVTMEKILLQENILTSVSQYSSLGTECRKNRPLNVLFCKSVNCLRKEMHFKNGRWLLFLQEEYSLEDIFKNVSIPFDCQIVVAKTIKGTVELTEVSNVQSSFHQEFYNIGGWSRHNGLHWTSTPFLKRTSNLRGIELRAAIAITCTTTTPNYVNKTIVDVGGFFGEVWSTLQQTMNFSSRYITHNYWGMKLINGTWTESMGSIIDNEADIGISAFSLTPNRAEAVDFLTPLMNGRSMLYIKEQERPRRLSSGFLKPFSWKLWALALVSLFLLAVCLWSTCSIGRECGTQETEVYSLLDAVLIVIRSYCGQGNETTPKTWSCRIIYVMSYLVGMILLSAYSASLVSFLAVGLYRYEPPFRSLEELLNGGAYNLSVPAGEEIHYFQGSTNIAAKLFYENHLAPFETSLLSYEEIHKKVCYEPRFAFIMSTYYISALQSLNKLSCRVTGIEAVSFPEILGMPIAKGSPYKEALNYNLLQLMSTGIIKRIRDLQTFKIINEIDIPVLEVTLEAILPIFIILSTGFILSTLFLILEIYIHHKLGRKRNYVF